LPKVLVANRGEIAVRWRVPAVTLGWAASPSTPTKASTPGTSGRPTRRTPPPAQAPLTAHKGGTVTGLTVGRQTVVADNETCQIKD
jgi:hypothetical protein